MKVLRIVLATCVGMVVSSVSMAGDNDRCLSGFDLGSVKGSDQKTLCTDACKPTAENAAKGASTSAGELLEVMGTALGS